MQRPDCLGYRHEGACPPTDAEAPTVRTETSFPKVCPWCGTDPGLARQFSYGNVTKFQVGCEDDDCPCNPQVSAYTLADAWKRWNTRAPR